MYLLAVKPWKYISLFFLSFFPLLIGSRRFNFSPERKVLTLESGTQRWHPDFNGSAKSVSAKACLLSEASRSCGVWTAGLITSSPTWRGQRKASANNPWIWAELQNMHFAGGVTTSGEHAKEARVNFSQRRLTGGLFVLTSFVFALSTAPCTLCR